MDEMRKERDEAASGGATTRSTGMISVVDAANVLRMRDAAPDMLEALTRIVFAYGANSAEPEAAFKAITVHIDVARAALSKATGQP